MPETLKISVCFYSYCRELAGTSEQEISVEAGSTIADLLRIIYATHPALEKLDKSLLIAVGVEYQLRDHRLESGDKVALFPPVQGG